MDHTITIFNCDSVNLRQVCVSMARQPVVLEMLFRAAPAQQGSTNLLIFSLLVPFIHRDGAIGQQARDALLLVMAASASHEAVARYIAENSYFCPVSDGARESSVESVVFYMSSRDLVEDVATDGAEFGHFLYLLTE